MRSKSRPLLLLSVICLSALLGCGGQQEHAAGAGTQAPSEAPPQEPGEQAGQPAGVGREASGNDTIPPGHPPLGGGPAAGGVVPPPPGTGRGAAGITWTVPPAWTEEKPSSSLRRAQYRVPGPAGEGECVVFYFGPGQGGDASANVSRWAEQFRQPDGQPSTAKMKTSTFDVGGMHVLQVEVTGIYSGGGMTIGMPPAGEKAGYMLLGAIAEGPDANWFFKFTGPEATVRANRAAWERMVTSLHVGLVDAHGG